MKFRFRMLIALVLILAILTPSGVVFSQINEDWDVVRQKHNIPEYIQRFSSNGFEFNLDIWKDKGLTVYGDAFVFSKNDFKPVTAGYYTNTNGQRGEYRYHGFTVEGNRYSNIDFPNDCDSGLLASQKRWIFEPWGKIDEINRNDYNWMAIRGDHGGKVREWLRVDFPLTSTTNPNKDDWNYFNCQTPSGLINFGEVRGWHDTYGSVWYQTFSLGMLTAGQKNQPDTSTTVEIVKKPISFAGLDRAVIEIRVTAVLNDSEYTGDKELETLYLNRKDVASAQFSIEGPMLPDGLEPVKMERFADGDFKIAATYLYELCDNESNRAFDSMSVTGFSKFIYVNNAGESPRTSGYDSAPIDWEAVILCDFNINTEIILSGPAQFSEGHLCYNDASRGDITEYSYYIRHEGSGLSSSFSMGSVNNDVVDSNLYNFIKPVLSGTQEQSFTLTQTVSDAKGNTDTRAKTINIKYGAPPVIVDPDPHIPENAFDIVPYSASDNTDMTHCVNCTVLIDGSVTSDFFSGAFIWGDEADGYHEVRVEYESVDGYVSVYTAWVLVHDTRPVAQFEMTGSFKENRKLVLEDNSTASNDPYVVSHYPIAGYSWRFTGENEYRKVNDISDVYKELLYKELGFYGVELTVRNSLRNSQPFVLNFEILPDNPPAINLNIWNNVLARGELMELTYEAVSVDGDSIAAQSFDIYYDENNDESYTKLIGTFTPEEFKGYTASSLGRYKIVAYAKEEFGQETLPEYVTDEDRKEAVIERYLFVDNFRPSTTLYADIPMVLPGVDVFILTDEGLDRSKNDAIKDNRMNYNNLLRFESMLPTLNIWDLHTYEYSTAASTTRHTGGSYPSSSISYSSGGYSGTLSRTSVRNDEYRVDEGYWATRKVYRTFSDSHDNVCTEYYNSSGNRYQVDYSWDGTNDHDYMTVGGDGFYGDIPKTGWSVVSGPTTTHNDDGSYEIETTYMGYYSGTLDKDEDYWVSNWVWYDDYTGYYSGTIYKYVKQPYTNPYKEKSRNYLIYVSDGSASNMDDLLTVTGQNDAGIVLIGSDAIKQQVPGYEHFILNSGGDINVLLDEALAYIISQNPFSFETYTLLPRDVFNVNYGNFDEESDPIIQEVFQYVHEPDFYDNPQGMESGCVEAFSEDSGWTAGLRNSFIKPGLYTVYRQIEDRASTDPDFAEYNKVSNIPFFRVCVNRRPVAAAELDWTYDTNNSVYVTSWVDLSYDPDHQYSMENKGIAERSIKLKRNSGPWQYRIPEQLEPGYYELEYYVRDVEGYWSLPFTMSFTLADAPPIQFECSLRSLKPFFTLAGIPASEYVEGYDMWTRYPYDVRLEMAFYNGSTRVSPVKSVSFSSDTGTKTGSDIYWCDAPYKIPETLPDGTYTFRIAAVDASNLNIRTEKDFTVTVDTPVDLVPFMPDKVCAAASFDINARTSKYASQVTVRLFKDTQYEMQCTMSGTPDDSIKEWTVNAMMPEDVPDGNYTAEFTAVTPNGNTETVNVDFIVENLRITGVTIEGYWNHWRGQVNMFGETMSVESHRFLSLECVKINVHTSGFADKVVIRFSPELESMYFTDKFGNVYDYAEKFFGEYVCFPEDSTFVLDDIQNENHVYWEYNLPLAPSTKDWDDVVQGAQYWMEVTAYKGEKSVVYRIEDIDITGNTFDLVYIQPVDDD